VATNRFGNEEKNNVRTFEIKCIKTPINFCMFSLVTLQGKNTIIYAAVADLKKWFFEENQKQLINLEYNLL
jgi:hypothetical protein